MRTLQEAAVRPRANFDALRRAEYLANIEHLRWLDGKATRASLLETIRRQIAGCERRSIGLACMLADVANTTDVHAEVAALYESLRADHDEDELLSLRLRLWGLAGDLDAQLRTAEQWARIDPLARAGRLHGVPTRRDARGPPTTGHVRFKLGTVASVRSAR